VARGSASPERPWSSCHRSHRCTAWREIPNRPRDLHHRNSIADHREDRLIPLLHDTQLHQHARECVADQAEPASPIRRSHVTRQAKPICHATGGTKHFVGGAGRPRTCDRRIMSPLPAIPGTCTNGRKRPVTCGIGPRSFPNVAGCFACSRGFCADRLPPVLPPVHRDARRAAVHPANSIPGRSELATPGSRILPAGKR
jgi:hypothetical protein